jgi:hypothetical protein
VGGVVLVPAFSAIDIAVAPAPMVSSSHLSLRPPATAPPTPLYPCSRLPLGLRHSWRSPTWLGVLCIQTTTSTNYKVPSGVLSFARVLSQDSKLDQRHLRPFPVEHSGSQHHIRPLLTRSVKACIAPCCTWIPRRLQAQRLVEFSQLRKHSSSSNR